MLGPYLKSFRSYEWDSVFVRIGFLTQARTRKRMHSKEDLHDWLPLQYWTSCLHSRFHKNLHDTKYCSIRIRITSCLRVGINRVHIYTHWKSKESQDDDTKPWQTWILICRLFLFFFFFLFFLVSLLILKTDKGSVYDRKRHVYCTTQNKYAHNSKYFLWFLSQTDFDGTIHHVQL